MRKGHLELVRKFGQPWELYDMERDRTEMHDLASVEAKRLSAMVAQWESWARRTHTIPWMWKPQYGA